MRGFCTIATGDDRYYILANNLLNSYKKFGGGGCYFAIVSDRENQYTEAFDKVVLIEHPTNSYLDKLQLIKAPPFQQTIFIDADCLVYSNIDYLFEFMPAKGVSCFGKEFSVESNGGWYTLDKLGQFSSRVNKIIGTHGGMIFINNDDTTKSVYRDIEKIAPHYYDMSFRGFSDPADEPILALAMAANNIEPLDYSLKNKAMLFYPPARLVILNMRYGKVSCVRRKKQKKMSGISIVHFNNKNTQTDRYMTEVAILYSQNKMEYLRLRMKEIYFNFKARYYFWRRCMGDLILKR